LDLRIYIAGRGALKYPGRFWHHLARTRKGLGCEIVPWYNFKVVLRNELNFERELCAKSRILVVSPLNTNWSYQLTSEAALRARTKTEHVKWVNVATWQKKLFEINKTDYLARWRYGDPTLRVKAILNLHGVNADPRFTKVTGDFSVPAFDSMEELRNYKLGDLNLGAIVFSAITSAKQTTSFTIDEISGYINHFFMAGFEINRRLEDEILKFKPDVVLSINDRLLGSSIAVSLARKHGIKSRIIYWGSDPNSVQDYEYSLYDSNEWQRQIALNWEEFPPSKAECEILQAKLDIFAHTLSQDSKEYTSSHVQGTSIIKKRRTCVFYAQSEHEHSPNFIPDTAGRFPNQYVAFQVLQELANLYEYDLVLKYHPIKNRHKQKTLSTANTLDWKTISLNANVLEIQPDSNVDTYKLMHDADLNIVWSSTVGLESIARGYPTLILGNTPWLNKDWGIHAWTKEDLAKFFAAPPDIIGRNSLIPWFWFLEGFGSPVKFSYLLNGFLTVNGFRIIQERTYLRPVKTVFFGVQRMLDKFSSSVWRKIP
jgi:hypothetical protein